MGAGSDRQVCDYEGCAWCDERPDIIVEDGRDAESIHEVLKIRRPAAAIGSRNPFAPPTWVKRLQRGKDVRAGQSFHAADRASTDFDPIAIYIGGAIHIGGAIRPADDNGHRPFRRLFWRPFEFFGRRGFPWQRGQGFRDVRRSERWGGDHDVHARHAKRAAPHP
jgi:hypothetical protein